MIKEEKAEYKESVKLSQEKNFLNTGELLLNQMVKALGDPNLPLNAKKVIHAAIPDGYVIDGGYLGLSLDPKITAKAPAEVKCIGSTAKTFAGLLCSLPLSSQKQIIYKIFKSGQKQTIINLLLGCYAVKNEPVPQGDFDPTDPHIGMMPSLMGKFVDGQMWLPKLDENGRLIPDGLIVDFPSDKQNSFVKMIMPSKIPFKITKSPLEKYYGFGNAVDETAQEIKKLNEEFEAGVITQEQLAKGWNESLAKKKEEATFKLADLNNLIDKLEKANQFASGTITHNTEGDVHWCNKQIKVWITYYKNLEKLVLDAGVKSYSYHGIPPQKGKEISAAIAKEVGKMIPCDNFFAPTALFYEAVVKMVAQIVTAHMVGSPQPF